MSYLPTLAQTAGLLAVIAVTAAFVVLGAAAGGANRRAEADLVGGWGIAVAAFVLAGAIARVPLGWVTVVLFAAAIACATLAPRRMRGPDARGLMLWAVLVLPLVLVVAAMVPSQWDEFTHWLPNTRYLVEHDDFFRAGVASPPSQQAAYPYALPLVSYMASQLTGYLVENSAALFNVILLGCFGYAVARVIAEARGQPRIGWGLAALGLLAVGPLNPTFVPKIVFTAYADNATGVALGFAALIAWQALNALAEGETARARALAWQFGFVATTLVALKQANLPLLAALIAAAGLAALAEGRLRAALPLAMRALLLPLAVWALWRVYVSQNFSGGEFEIRPFAEWSLALIPDVIARMALIASKKGGYFGLMLIALGFAVRGIVRPRTAFDRLAVIAGGMFLAYNLFLLFTYITAFGDNDALRAASYWRYNTHLGGIAVLFAVYGIARLWRWPLPRIAAAAAVVLVLIAPVALAAMIRFDVRAPKLFVRAVGAEIQRTLSQDDRIVLIDTTDSGVYVMMMYYTLHGGPRVAADFTTAARGNLAIPPAATHAWVHVPTPAVEAALDATLPSGASYLLRRSGGRWTVVKSWPYPGYRLPSDDAD